jgi:hypothetical protein
MSKNSNRNRAAQTATETANAYEQPVGDTGATKAPETTEPVTKPEDTQGAQAEKPATESFESTSSPANLTEKIAAITSEQRAVNFMDNSEKPAAAAPVEAVKTKVDPLGPVPQPANVLRGMVAASAPEVTMAATPTEPVVIAKQTVLPPAIPVDPYQLPLSCSAGSRLTVQELREYVEKMSSRVRMPAAEGGQVQSGLYHILIQAINTRAEDFDATFGTVMRVIRDNLPGVFSMENMHRYTPHATLPSKTMAHFRYLLSVLTGLADPALRNETARQTSLEKAFRSMNIKEEARQRVLNFFNF